MSVSGVGLQLLFYIGFGATIYIHTYPEMIWILRDADINALLKPLYIRGFLTTVGVGASPRGRISLDLAGVFIYTQVGAVAS